MLEFILGLFEVIYVVITESILLLWRESQVGMPEMPCEAPGLEQLVTLAGVGLAFMVYCVVGGYGLLFLTT